MSDLPMPMPMPGRGRRRRRRGGRNRNRGFGPAPEGDGYAPVAQGEAPGSDRGPWGGPPVEDLPPPPEEPFTPPPRERLYEFRVLELLREGHGFLRSPAGGYVPTADDPYVSASLVRQYGMRDGSVIDGEIGPPKRRGQNPQLLKPTSIDGVAPHLYRNTAAWDSLTVVDPDRKIDLTSGFPDPTNRIIDLMAPIGFGQRGLITSPPRAGKTIILQKIAQAVMRNHPDTFLIVLLVDERPEEATAMRRAVQGEVAVSTNDKPPENHVRLTELVLKKAKRLVETGRDVVILMDSLTRLGRAYNLLQRGGGRTLSGGLDSRSLERPKALFGGARNIEGGGSLTIIATALIDTGSKMEQLIFEELKCTGNM
jgi:transcription termination factor Rho